MKITTLISYFPASDNLLIDDLVSAIKTQDKSRLSEILLQYEIIGSNIITGARWIDNSIIVCMASVEKNLEHMRVWSDNKINEFFNVDITPYKQGYELTLWPDLEKTVRRHELMHLVKNDEFVTDTQYNVLFCPLRFRTDNGHMPEKIPEKITIGFADSSAKCRDYKITLNDVYAVVKDITVQPIRRA